MGVHYLLRTPWWWGPVSSLVSCRTLNIFYAIGAFARCNFGGFSPGWCCIKPGNSDLRQFKRLGIQSKENISVNPCLQEKPEYTASRAFKNNFTGLRTWRNVQLHFIPAPLPWPDQCQTCSKYKKCWLKQSGCSNNSRWQISGVLSVVEGGCGDVSCKHHRPSRVPSHKL